MGRRDEFLLGFGNFENRLHTVELRYLNDLRTATCDRNLYVFDVSFHDAV